MQNDVKMLVHADRGSHTPRACNENHLRHTHVVNNNPPPRRASPACGRLQRIPYLGQRPSLADRQPRHDVGVGGVDGGGGGERDIGLVEVADGERHPPHVDQGGHVRRVCRERLQEQLLGRLAVPLLLVDEGHVDEHHGVVAPGAHQWRQDLVRLVQSIQREVLHAQVEPGVVIVLAKLQSFLVHPHRLLVLAVAVQRVPKLAVGHGVRGVLLHAGPQPLQCRLHEPGHGKGDAAHALHGHRRRLLPGAAQDELKLAVAIADLTEVVHHDLALLLVLHAEVDLPRADVLILIQCHHHESRVVVLRRLHGQRQHGALRGVELRLAAFLHLFGVEDTHGAPKNEKHGAVAPHDELGLLHEVAFPHQLFLYVVSEVGTLEGLPRASMFFPVHRIREVHAPLLR
mmetsp:Transcript_43637/g.136927  ORF Transcript_43637/g.136927 Transcript_43637/m.136927 type:complete len:400 (+) Transcript_43637:135-1334(+)